MWPKKQLLLVYVTWISIDQCFSSIIWDATHYSEHRQTSVYRGLLFTLSAEQKYEICRSSLIAYIYSDKPMKAADTKEYVTFHSEQELEGRPQFPVAVHKGDLTAENGKYFLETEELFFQCFAKFHNNNLEFTVGTLEYLISSAFVPSGTCIWTVIVQNSKSIIMLRLVLEPPEYVRLNQDELEKQYLNMLTTMEALSTESADYIKLVEENNNFSLLSASTKFTLCTSILASPVYLNEENLVHFYNQDDKNLEDILRYQQKPLEFLSTKYHFVKSLPSDRIVCKAKRVGNGVHEKVYNLFLIPSFNDSHSLYVVKEEEKRYLLSKYFTKVPLLMNISVP